MIRRAALSDIKGIFSVYSSAIDKLLSEGINQWDDVYPNINTIRNDVERGEMYLVILDGHIAACAVINSQADGYENGSWKFGDNYRVIHRLCVNPLYQSKGVGKRILSFAEDEIKKQGYSSVRIDVFPSNQRAMSLYKNEGYIDVGEVEYRKGVFRLMEKKL